MKNIDLTALTGEDSPATDESLLQAQRAELAAIVDRHCPAEGPCPTPIPGVVVFRGTRTDLSQCSISGSRYAMMAQGAKRLRVGDEVYDYDARQYLISAVNLPVFSQLTEASALEPYLGFSLELDLVKLAEISTHLPNDPEPASVDRGIAVAPQSVAIQDATLRLARLLDTPADIPVLAPLAERELLYRLLTGRLGARLRQALQHDSHSQRIVRAMSLLQARLAEPISVDEMAATASMSKSSLHFHFKSLTGMTPLQYQKQLRLQEARRLMLSEDHDAAAAAHRVGYESPSQFSREYRRLFGKPPASDVAALRGNA